MVETYQASNASGFELSTKPMVLGLVACSIAYAVPVASHSFQRVMPSRSMAESSPLGFSGSAMPQKLTVNEVRRQGISVHAQDEESHDALLDTVSVCFISH